MVRYLCLIIDSFMLSFCIFLFCCIIFYNLSLIKQVKATSKELKEVTKNKFKGYSLIVIEKEKENSNKFVVKLIETPQKKSTFEEKIL